MEAEAILIKNINVDACELARVKLNEATVVEYANLYEAGVKMPPGILYTDQKTFWLADGRHRMEARLQLGLDDFEVEAYEGTFMDACLYAFSANLKHGLPLTLAEKKANAYKMLGNPEWSKWSDHAIAKQCGLSHTFIGEMRTVMSEALATADSGWEETSARYLDGTPVVPDAAHAEGPVYDEDVVVQPKPVSDPATPENTSPEIPVPTKPVLRIGRDGRTIDVSNIGKSRSKPLLCERCQRVGEVKDCLACAMVRGKVPARTAQEEDKLEPPPANGKAEVWDWRLFEEAWDGLQRMPAMLYRAYGRVDSKGAVREDNDYHAMKRLLTEFHLKFQAVHDQLTEKAKVGV